METHCLTPEERMYEQDGLWTEEWFSDDDRLRVNELSSRIPTETSSVLDAGCGNGLFLHYLQEKRPDIGRLCGVERSESAIAHVRTEKYRASIDSMPFRDHEFDLVSSMEVFEHLPVNILNGAVSEIGRIASRYIIITVPYVQDLQIGMTICPLCRCRFNANYHVRSFNENNIAKLFDGKGFACKDVFHIRPRKILPYTMAASIDIVRLYKHRIQGLRKAYPPYAVCPACGFHDNEKTLPKSLRNVAAGRSIRQQFIRLFSWKKSYRWIGAIFERQT